MTCSILPPLLPLLLPQTLLEAHLEQGHQREIRQVLSSVTLFWIYCLRGFQGYHPGWWRWSRQYSFVRSHCCHSNHNPLHSVPYSCFLLFKKKVIFLKPSHPSFYRCLPGFGEAPVKSRCSMGSRAELAHSACISLVLKVRIPSGDTLSMISIHFEPW